VRQGVYTGGGAGAATSAGSPSDARGVCMASQQAGRVAREASRNRCRLGQAVEAVQTWLAAGGITEGPVFRSVLKGGRVQPGHLPGRFVAAIVKRYGYPRRSRSRRLRRPQPAGRHDHLSRGARRVRVQDPRGVPPQVDQRAVRLRPASA